MALVLGLLLLVVANHSIIGKKGGNNIRMAVTQRVNRVRYAARPTSLTLHGRQLRKRADLRCTVSYRQDTVHSSSLGYDANTTCTRDTHRDMERNSYPRYRSPPRIEDRPRLLLDPRRSSL